MKARKLFCKYNVFLVFIIDTLLVVASFLISVWPKDATISTVIPTYQYSFLFYLATWVLISSISGKYNMKNFHGYQDIFITITIITLLSSFIILFLLFAVKQAGNSRLVVLGTLLLSYISSLVFYYLIYTIFIANKRKIEISAGETNSIQNLTNSTSTVNAEKKENDISYYREEMIRQEAGETVLQYIEENLNLGIDKVNISETATPFNISNIQGDNLFGIVNLKKVNDMRYINQFFEAVNSKLMDAGMFIGCVETSKQRYKRIGKNKWSFISQLVIMTDFIINRVFPRLPAFQNIYFNITLGAKRTVSLAEVLGRLVSSGFSIIEYKEIDNLTYFVVMKTSTPKLNDNPSYKPIFDMPRIGKGGKIIKVYKIRTMHPFSEYLQDYVLSLNGFSNLGKIKDDFRVTKWGKFLRRTHLDEFPQVWNLLKGDMAIFGCRPLSRGVFNKEYPKEIQEMRIKYKPGLIPPYAALKMQGMKESIEAEKIYLGEKINSKLPFFIDVKYLFKALYNLATFKIKGA